LTRRPRAPSKYVSIPSSSGQVFIRGVAPGVCWLGSSLGLNPFFIRSSIHPEKEEITAREAVERFGVSIPSSSGQVFILVRIAFIPLPALYTGVSIPSSSGQVFILNDKDRLEEALAESQSLLHQVKYSSSEWHPVTIDRWMLRVRLNPFFIRSSIHPKLLHCFC